MITHNCRVCGAVFESTRRDAMYCTPRCRKKAWAGAALIEPLPTLPGPVEREVRSILTSLHLDGADDVARAALRVAGAIDDPHTPASALAGLTKVLPETLAYLRETHGEEDL
ncbi:hypothetical protein OHB24_27180 [Kribbella sp. NBC_00482]|uniref:hypothetical protein n=1 Tax=Kribbella sp. NBC_00482 TaxID=2975968 RepID=UPI002E17F7D5